jgi:hypothetical protein
MRFLSLLPPEDGLLRARSAGKELVPDELPVFPE